MFAKISNNFVKSCLSYCSLVEMDARGHIVIPSAFSKAKGFGAHTLFVLFADGDEERLIPGEVRPKREIRMYRNGEVGKHWLRQLAQGARCS